MSNFIPAITHSSHSLSPSQALTHQFIPSLITRIHSLAHSLTQSLSLHHPINFQAPIQPRIQSITHLRYLLLSLSLSPSFLANPLLTFEHLLKRVSMIMDLQLQIEARFKGNRGVVALGTEQLTGHSAAQKLVDGRRVLKRG